MNWAKAITNRAGLAALLLFCLVPTISATPIIFTASDDNATFGSLLPNSNAAYAAFVAAIPGAVVTQHLDEQPTGYQSNYNLNPAQGVALNLLGFNPSGTGFTSNNSNPNYGFNTSATGSRFLQLLSDPAFVGGSTATFTFANPTHAFGFYVTALYGDATSPLHVEFNDGSFQSYTVPDLPNSTAQFWGFVTPGSVSSVTVRLDYPGTGYYIGLDDITYEAPEPATYGLSAAGLLLMAWLPLRKRKQQK